MANQKKKGRPLNFIYCVHFNADMLIFFLCWLLIGTLSLSLSLSFFFYFHFYFEKHLACTVLALFFPVQASSKSTFLFWHSQKKKKKYIFFNDCLDQGSKSGPIGWIIYGSHICLYLSKQKHKTRRDDLFKDDTKKKKKKKTHTSSFTSKCLILHFFPPSVGQC